MPIFKNQEHALSIHSEYDIDTEAEGKYEFLYKKSNFVKGAYRILWIMEQIEDQSFVLEIGCNSGGFCRALTTKKECYCVGIDPSKQLVDRAMRKGVNARIGHGEKIEFDDNKFEVVLMTEVLEHVFNPPIVLNEIKRVLQPGGIFVGSVPHPDGHNSMKRELKDHQYHGHIFSHESLNDMFKDFFIDIVFEDISWCLNGCDNKTPQWICFKARIPNEKK